MRKVLITEFGGCHSETLGFFVSVFKEIGFDVFVYYEGSPWYDTYLSDLTLAQDFQIISDWNVLLDFVEKNFFDFAVFNSARNLRVGRSKGVALFRMLQNCIGDNRILIQIHNEADSRLDFVCSFDTLKIAPSPFLKSYADDYFLPVYDGVSSILKTPVNFDSESPCFIKIGGGAKHSEGNFCEGLLESISCHNAHVHIYYSGDIGNEMLSKVIGNGGVVIQKKGPLSVFLNSLRFRSFNWIVNSPDGIYANRILTGSLPYSINYGLPPLIDTKTISAYELDSFDLFKVNLDSIKDSKAILKEAKRLMVLIIFHTGIIGKL